MRALILINKTVLHSNDNIYSNLGIDPKISLFCNETLKTIAGYFGKIDETAEYNQIKTLSAMQGNRLSETHFAATTGYGYNDAGRDILESIYADIFNTELALVRPQLISGTHAISTALFANLTYGSELLLATGIPYDTLQGVIGIRKTKCSLAEHGVSYKTVGLANDGSIDLGAIKSNITKKTKMVAIQRSKGYSWRRSFSVAEIAEAINTVKSINKDIICFVDNCYGEFVEINEPSNFGADIIAGSLIKNPGGGLAPVGGYIAGKAEFVENAAYRLTAPGLGREAGPALGTVQPMLQGLFLAPAVVAASLKSAIFAAALFERLGYETLPTPAGNRTDIVQAIKLGSPEKLISFCRGIQKAAAVDSFVSPEPWGMPGYDCPVIMAAGAFVQGSSIELSADAPLKPPYIVYMQGSLTWQHAKAGIMIALNEMLKDGHINHFDLEKPCLQPAPSFLERKETKEF